MNDTQLKQLINACASGDTKAQAFLYKQFSPKLYGISLRYASNRTDAEDILQDSFIRIFEKIKTYQFKGSFEGWLRRIVINIALQKIKKQQFNEEINERVLTIETPNDFNDTHVPIEILLQMIQELPNRYRMVFNLYVLDGYKHYEIAELLNITEGTSKSNLARARRILQEKLNNFMEGK